jgi:hypothetical protein
MLVKEVAKENSFSVKTPVPQFWEAEIGRIEVRGQSGQIVCEVPFPKITRAK